MCEGRTHALSGAAVFLLAAAPPTSAPMLRPVALACLTVCAAGAAMGPDSDHPRAGIAFSLPPVSRWVCQVIGRVSGGHRHATHAPLMLLVVYAGGWLAVHWSYPVHQLGLVVPPGGVLLVLLLTAFGAKALRLVRHHAWPVAALVASTAGLTFTARDWALIPAVLTLGWAAHIAGDFLTPEGVPLFWPLHPPGPEWVPESVWGGNGYVRVPVLNSVGSAAGSGRFWWHPVRWVSARREALLAYLLGSTAVVVAGFAAVHYMPPDVVQQWVTAHY